MKASHTNTITKSRRNQSGLAAVEFVIVMLMLVPMVVATVELGRYIYQYNTLTKAVRNGARYAGDNALTRDGVIVSGGDLANLEDETQNLVAYGDINGNGTKVLKNIDPEKVSVTPVDVDNLSAGNISPSHINVSASYDFDFLFDFIPDNIGITMTASTVQPAI